MLYVQSNIEDTISLKQKQQITFNVKIQTSQNVVSLWIIVSLWLNRRHYHLSFAPLQAFF